MFNKVNLKKIYSFYRKGILIFRKSSHFTIKYNPFND